MPKGLLNKIKHDFSTLEISFLCFMSFCGFCLAAEAAITKSVSTSYFIERYSVTFFPYAWLLSMPINLILVAIYNKTIDRLGPVKILGTSIFITIALYLCCLFYLDESRSLPLILYISKEVLVMFMFHSLWSVLHASIHFDRAKYLYGIFFGFGGLGSIFGGWIVSSYAQMGSANLLIFTIPLYLLTFFCYAKGCSLQGNMRFSQKITFSKKKKSSFYGIKLIRNSNIMLFILIFVACQQLTTTLIEYQFNGELGHHFPQLDSRTKYLGSILSIINCINVFMQFVGSYLFVQSMGLLKAYFLLPSIILFKFLVYLCCPSFFMLSLSYGVVKAIDYSIFGILTGMLYIPLSVEEKFHGRVFINVFAYRGSKFIASFAAFFLVVLPFGNIVFITFILMIWIYTIFLMQRQFAKTYIDVLARR